MELFLQRINNRGIASALKICLRVGGLCGLLSGKGYSCVLLMSFIKQGGLSFPSLMVFQSGKLWPHRVGVVTIAQGVACLCFYS